MAHLVNMKEGNRSLIVVSVNPDNFIQENTQWRITQMPQQNKIRISDMQEKHIQHGQNYKLNGYRIITSAAMPEIQPIKKHESRMPIAGVAILIQEELERHICSIKG